MHIHTNTTTARNMHATNTQYVTVQLLLQFNSSSITGTIMGWHCQHENNVVPRWVCWWLYWSTGDYSTLIYWCWTYWSVVIRQGHLQDICWYCLLLIYLTLESTITLVLRVFMVLRNTPQCYPEATITWLTMCVYTLCNTCVVPLMWFHFNLNSNWYTS